MNAELKVADNMVVTIEYELKVDGEVVDSSKDEGPLEYLQGHQNIIPGLEKELLGLKVGDSKSVTVQPADGYGEYEEDSVMNVPREEFPEDIPLEIGTELQVRDMEGEVAYAQIVEVGGDTITLDMNHPLAGEALHFEVKVVGVRAASEEEISHGHAHHAGGHGH